MRNHDDVAEFCFLLFFYTFFTIFTSPTLLKKLLDKGVYATGTVRPNRKNMPQNLPEDKSMQRGDSAGVCANGLSAVKWMDTRSVILLSNFHCPNAISNVTRREKRSSQIIRLSCPVVVSDYNSHMGGVDLTDRSWKWHTSWIGNTLFGFISEYFLTWWTLQSSMRTSFSENYEIKSKWLYLILSISCVAVLLVDSATDKKASLTRANQKGTASKTLMKLQWGICLFSWRKGRDAADVPRKEKSKGLLWGVIHAT